MKEFKLVVFDWDGTLVNSCNHIAESFQNAIAELDFPDLGKDHIKQHIGCSMFQAIQSLYPSLTEKQRAEIIERYRQHFFAGNHQVTLFEGAKEALLELQELGYLLAVATGSSRERFNQDLKTFGLERFFVATKCADESFSKPHPQMLLDIMEQTGVKSKETLMVGDTEFDMQMAINAGVPAIAVECGVHDTERLLMCEPLACLHSVKDLPKWLSRQ